MAELKLQHLDKIYDNKVQAVFDFNMDVKDGELIVLVGPSGCGKSTTLRMVAGLEDISAGHLLLDGKDITQTPAKDRDMAMVFQNYALYGHMTIYENMAFSLTLRKEDPNVIHKKVLAAAEILGLTSQLNKKPNQLSGGQRQRVAMGRSIVRNPKVFLFDEPLSNLDAKLRGATRREILLLHKRLKATMLYVTHDQTEALTLADRIVCMSMGHVQQIGTPLELYDQPNNTFVAGFIGLPPMNFYPDMLFEDGIHLVTGIRTNMKNKLMPMWDKIMLRKRCIIETINDMLKNTAQLVHSRHRSVNNFIMNMVATLAAYCFFDNKPQALQGYYIEDTKQLMLKVHYPELR